MAATEKDQASASESALTFSIVIEWSASALQVSPKRVVQPTGRYILESPELQPTSNHRSELSNSLEASNNGNAGIEPDMASHVSIDEAFAFA